MKVLIKYETAELAKEKGFPQNIPYDHYIVGEDKKFMTDYFYKSSLIDDYKNNLLGCPTQSELQKWLRDEKSLYIDIYTECTVNEILGFNYKITSWYVLPQQYKRENISGFELTYEQALEQALINGLNLIKIN